MYDDRTDGTDRASQPVMRRTRALRTSATSQRIQAKEEEETSLCTIYKLYMYVLVKKYTYLYYKKIFQYFFPSKHTHTHTHQQLISRTRAIGFFGFTSGR